MKLSLIISSFNQQKRLKHCIQSALNQQIGPNATSYEIIIADDHSTDGTFEMVKEKYPSVAIYQNDKSEDGIYTLADNWNHAAKFAKGDRFIFSNGDLVYSPKFIEAHADPNFKEHILIGPAMRTSPYIEPYINNLDFDYKQLIQYCAQNNWLNPDMRAGKIAHTYMREEPPWHVYGYNFSLPRKYFNGVKGFPSFKQYGGEDLKIAEAVVEKYKCKCLTNQNAMAFHLWHAQVNYHGVKTRTTYKF